MVSGRTLASRIARRGRLAWRRLELAARFAGGDPRRGVMESTTRRAPGPWHGTCATTLSAWVAARRSIGALLFGVCEHLVVGEMAANCPRVSGVP